VVVCHGEVMWGFRVRVERLTQRRYEELDLSRDPFDHIHNGQIIHYTRVSPETGRVSRSVDWVRRICPWDETRSSGAWAPIARPRATNEELLAEAAAPRPWE